MANKLQGFQGMPGPKSSKTPIIFRTDQHLTLFFSLIHYVDIATLQLWMFLLSYNTSDYDAWKARIIKKYPGAEKGIRYIFHDLEHNVVAHAEADSSTKSQLMQFSRQFHPVTAWLANNSKVSKFNQDKLFWQGLPKCV
ncbi:hypothetical protein V8B97DRAFT_2026610 [Scleroderma yunnanense]